jgi:MOSC domain-containing protein YiiM
MKKIFLLVIYSLFFIAAFAQNATIPVGENLVIDGIPPLSTKLVNDVKNYNEARSAGFVTWHPLKKEMMITTRFANSAQLHYVKFPGGDRKQITFFE